MGFITLFQLNNLLQKTLEEHLEATYWVVSEIGEMRINQKGHCYLELVEKEGQHLTAKIRANIWAYDFRNLNGFFHSVTGKKLGTGMKVLTKVAVQFHEVFGLSLHVRDIDPSFTLGERARARQQVIDRLTKEGSMHRNRDVRLPVVPQRIAVVSAETAAGYGDFIDQLVNNPQNFHFHVQLFKTVMQGAEARASLVTSLDRIFDQYNNFDVIVIIRGGGSQVDLDCFDDYQVATHVSRSPLPIITGIGHERDETVVDLVAHTSLKTPTAVASFLLSGMKTFDQQLLDLQQRLRLGVLGNLQLKKTDLVRLGGKLEHNVKAHMQQSYHRQDLLAQRTKLGVEKKLHLHHEKLRHFYAVLTQEPQKILKLENKLLEVLSTKVALADPKRLLERGFSITYQQGVVVKNAESLKPGDEITTRTRDHNIVSKVSNISHERKN